MATMTPTRHNSNGYTTNESRDTRQRYIEYSQGQSSTAKAYDYRDIFPEYKPYIEEKKEPKKVETKDISWAKGFKLSKKQMWKVVPKIAGVMILCCIMIYRYAVILETNDSINKMTESLAGIESANQAIQFKIDRELEMGALEEYATKELGMIRPDNAHMFYIDMELGDGTERKSNEGEDYALKGTPGALVNAIQVLK